MLVSDPPPTSLPPSSPTALPSLAGDIPAVVELLARDLDLLQDADLAEQLQLEELGVKLDKADEPFEQEERIEDRVQLQEDLLLALEMTKDTAQLEADATLARTLENEVGSPQIRLDRMMAEQVAAGEKKIAVDRIFAEHLQDVADKNVNIDRMVDAEKELGVDAVQGIINAQDPNSKGKEKADVASPLPAAAPSDSDQPATDSKGKGKARDPASEEPVASAPSVIDAPSPYKKCGICWDPCRPVANPLKSSASATSSAQVSYGIALKCGHAYCLGCLTKHLCEHLDGDGGSLMVVFPVACPDCHDGKDAFTDDVAEAVLDESNMERWWRARILEGLPKLYCTNRKCGALVVGPEQAHATQAQCPCCEEQMCAQCQTKWHPDLTCEEYQALPEVVKEVEDRQLLDLAEGQKWGRCPKCKYMVERSQGCNHIVCRCRQEFCYACGSEWAGGRCGKGCDLFHVPPDIHGVRRPAAQARAGLPAATQALGPIEAWANANGGLASRTQHLYTSLVVVSQTCPYCAEKASSDQALYRHFDAAAHPVYFHCERLFPSEATMGTHVRVEHGGEEGA